MRFLLFIFFFLIMQIGTSNVLANTNTQVNIQNKNILKWSENMATKVRAYDFVNYRDHFKLSKHSEKDKWLQDYFDNLKKTGEIQAVKNKRLLVHAKPNGKPIILNQGIYNNLHFWKIQIPILVTYQSINGNVNNPTVIIMQLTQCKSDSGICVGQINEIYNHPNKLTNILCNDCFK